MAEIPKRIVRSYNAYLRYREKQADRGYGLDRQLTLVEYSEVHPAFAQANAHNPKKTHIAREIAAMDRTFSREQAAAIVRRLKVIKNYEGENVDKELLKELLKTYKTSKDIYSLNLTPEQQQILEQRRRERLIERGKNPADYNIQASARAEFFQQLIDAGISYKDADKIIYGE